MGKDRSRKGANPHREARTFGALPSLCFVVAARHRLRLTRSGGKDATGPNPGGDPPGDGQNPPPAGDVSGVYVLANVNDANPGQTVTLANPDGGVIGMFRFDPRHSQLELNADGTWSFSLAYDDNGQTRQAEDGGTWSPDEIQQDGYVFKSNRYGGEFHCLAKQGVALIGYDFDGDGQIDTFFAFGRLGSQG